MAPSPGTVVVPPASFAQTQQPLRDVSPLIQQAPNMIPVAVGLAMSFPSQPLPQSAVYSSVPLAQPRQPAAGFSGQPNFPNPSFPVGQQPSVRVVHPVGAATVQPVFGNPEPQPQPVAVNQTQFLGVPNAGTVDLSSHQPAILHRLPRSAVGDGIPRFDGAAIRATGVSVSAPFPGYLDFGAGEGNPIRFKAGFASDPEIVGQPIETVIHNRQAPNEGRTAVTSGQNRAKPFTPAK